MSFSCTSYTIQIFSENLQCVVIHAYYSTTECSIDQFHCDNTRCISKSRQCDKFADCLDEKDEENCGCTESEFQCNTGQCIYKEFVCDGRYDCPNRDDEEHDCGKYMPLINGKSK